jgi:hypothetical protein
MNHPLLNGFFAMVRHSQFLNVVRKMHERREEIAAQTDTAALDHAVSEYLTNHDTMEAMARGIDARIVAVLQPYIHLRRTITSRERALRVMKNYAYRKDFMSGAMTRLREDMAARTRRPHARFVDGTIAFDGSTEECFVDEVHLTRRGGVLLLRHVAAALRG